MAAYSVRKIWRHQRYRQTCRTTILSTDSKGNQVKITDVRVQLLSAPYPEGHEWNTGYGKGYKRDMVLVFVDTDEGLTGIGESYHAFTGARTIEALIQHSLKPLLVGEDPTHIDTLWQRMFMGTIQLGSAAIAAISGVDIALWDILGRSVDRPVYELLGAGGATALPAYVGCHTLGIQDEESLVAEAKSYASAGFRAVKVRGGAGVDADVRAVAAVTEALGPEADVLIDANSAYSWPEAVELNRKLAELDVFWLEDPFDFTVLYHHRELGRLRELGNSPIASGANIYSRYDYRDLVEAGGVDYITPDVVKGGGISETVKIAQIASAFGQLVGLHTVVGLGQFASLHLAATIAPHVFSYVEWDPSEGNPLRDDIFTNPIKVEQGRLLLPTAPGIGTDLNLDALERYPFIDGPEIEMSLRKRRWA